MTEWIDVAAAFSMPLKVAWAAWLVWGAGQVYWYRHEQQSNRTERSKKAGPRVAAAAGLRRAPMAVSADTRQHQQAVPETAAPVSTSQPADHVPVKSELERDAFIADVEQQEAPAVESRM